MRARASGVKLEQEYAQLVTMREGLVTRDESWFRWEEGLRAVGLDRDAVALPKRAMEASTEQQPPWGCVLASAETAPIAWLRARPPRRRIARSGRGAEA